jgi:GNAT superfamily N-acetyltransferase
MNAIQIRRLDSSDSLEALTGLLHRAFAPLGRRGLNCQSVDQRVETTLERVSRGECLVAVAGGRIVGTLTLHGPDAASPVARYREPSVGSIHQFAVEPGYQGRGVGHALLRAAECRASSAGRLELALDTPQPARHQRAYYGRRGFKEVDTVQLEGRRYRSVVLSKPIKTTAVRQQADHWPWRHPAEMAAMALARARRHRYQGVRAAVRPRVVPQTDALVAR